ncbi:MAG TPA: chloride channel protein [Isosphaeraceae bacterium]|jgi:CIC family chloride channel protein|nr:chloride channel protein [Isosphaeraceae bacterium]
MTEPSPRLPFVSRLTNGLRVLVAQWATPGPSRLALCSVFVGVVAGLGAVLFLVSLQATMDLAMGRILGFQLPPTGEGTPHAVTFPHTRWLVPLVPMVGGLISGLIVFTWAPEAEGHGTDALIRAFHRGGGMIRARVPLVKGIASVITIGTGGSAGQEGPIAQIGAGFGSFLARLLRLTAQERQLLMLAGAAGGIGAIFRAPLGGALFGVEILYSTAAIESAALMPCLASSILAYTTFALFITPEPIFLVPSFHFRGLSELPLFAILAVACAGFGWLYVRVFYGIRDRIFRPLRLPRHVKPALGGLLVGLMALAFPELMTGGYGWVQWGAIGMPPKLTLPGETPFVPHLAVGTLLLLALLKTVATGLTISSGGSGGVFGPSVFIGAMLGGALGQIFRQLLPSWDIAPQAFALVGMGGFFAGVAKCPLTSIVIICEMTGSYSLLVPLMLVCSLNLGLSRRWKLYEEQVPSPIDSPAHQGDFVIDVLQRIRVGQVPLKSEGIERVPEAAPFSELVRLVAGSNETLFPVVDPEGRLTGIFNLRDLRRALVGSDWGPLVIADDLATRPVVTVTPDDDLHTALKRLTTLNMAELPVVATDDPARLIGLLSRNALEAAYTAQIEALKVPHVPPG